MKRFKSLYKEAKVEVDDISVGVKKKKPAGVKADEPLKGYAYNEKMKFRFKGKNPHKLKLEELEENRADCIKGLERLVKTGGIDKKAFQKGHDLYKAGKVKDLKKHIQELDTDPLEAIVATIARCDSKTFNSMYPRAKANDYLSSIVYQHRESVENTFDSIVETMMVEIELDEALSPKEKEKRLLMIKKAVEKLNRANIEKIKKQAMRDMKASGMFDDVIDEETELEEDDDFRPSEADIKRNTYLRYNVKQLEPMMKDALKAHDENEHMKRASEQHYRQTGRYLPNESPDDYQKRKKKLENKLKLLQRAYAAAKVRRQRLLKNKQTNESLADDAPLTRKSDDGKHVQLHKDRKIMSAIRKGMSDHEKKHMARAYRDDTDIVHRDTGKTMGSIHGKTVDQARSEIRKHIAKHHPETQKAKFGDVENVSSTRKIYTVRDEAEVERIKDKYKKATDGKYTVRPMKRKEGFKVYVDKKVV